MRTLTLPLPDDLHRALSERARVNGRSVEEEVLNELIGTTSVVSFAEDQPAQAARAFGQRLHARGFVPFTEDELKAAIREGRP